MIIICGIGRVGSRVAKILKENGEEVVVIEKNPEISNLLKRKYKIVRGSALDEKVLKKAGIKDARWVVITTGEDADNLYIIFKARELNPKIKIAVRVSNEEALESFERSNVDLIVMPEVVGGIHLANAILGKKTKEKLVRKK